MNRHLAATVLMLVSLSSFGEDSTLRIISDERVVLPQLLLGNPGTNNIVVITNQGQLVTGFADLSPGAVIGGGSNSAHNAVYVSGIGSAWTNASRIVLGEDGNHNLLVIENGGTLWTDFLSIGGRTNRLEVRGNGSTLLASSLLSMESASTLLVSFSEGARVALRGIRLNGPAMSFEASDSICFITNDFSVFSPEGSQSIIGPNTILEVGNLTLTGGSNRFSAFGPSTKVSARGEIRIQCTNATSSLKDLDLNSGGNISFNGNNHSINISNATLRSNTRFIFTPKGGKATITDSGIYCGDGFSVFLSDQSLFHLAGTSIIVSNTSTLPNVILGRTVIERSLLAFPSLEFHSTNFIFNSGTLAVRTLRIEGGSTNEFVIGDGINKAILTLSNSTVTTAASIQVSSNSVLEGFGLFISDTPVLQNFGQIKPRGTISYLGNLTNLGEVLFDVSAAALGPQAQLEVSREARLGGRAELELSPEYTPKSTHRIELMKWKTSTGSFTNLSDGQRVAIGVGTYLVSYLTNGLVLGDFFHDSDQDGIDDAWANLHFGHSPLSELELTADLDGDTLSTREEARLGTNPTDVQSNLKITADRGTTGNILLRVTSVMGKRYEVLESANLVDWSSLPSLTVVSKGGAISWQIPLTEPSSRFYRVAVKTGIP